MKQYSFFQCVSYEAKGTSSILDLELGLVHHTHSFTYLSVNAVVEDVIVDILDTFSCCSGDLP